MVTAPERLLRDGVTHVNDGNGDGVLDLRKIDVHRVGADAEHRRAGALQTLCRFAARISPVAVPVTLSLQRHDRSEID